MPTDDFNAMVPADPAPTTEKKGKKKLVWSTRTQIMAMFGAEIASAPYELPTDAPLLALQQGVANVMYATIITRTRKPVHGRRCNHYIPRSV